MDTGTESPSPRDASGPAVTPSAPARLPSAATSGFPGASPVAADGAGQAVPGAAGSQVFDAAVAFVHAAAGDARMKSGESVVEHALGTARLLGALDADPPSMLAAVLFPVSAQPAEIERVVGERYGAEVNKLIADVRKLSQLGVVGVRAADAHAAGDRDASALRRAHVESLRKLLLAFAQDIRVVLVRFASRLQTLRYHASVKTSPAAEVARETLEIYAPLANRLGIWQLKWELEDLAFRFEDPDTYRRIARLLDEKRVEREAYVAAAIARLQNELAAADIPAEVSGRPKHIYSIWRKMRGKDLDFSELYDVRAFRVIVGDVKDCYTVLGIVHNIWQPIPREFDDYISRPKPNGYKSLHTVVIGDDGRAFEVQIRTREMHEFAEYGVAAHWRYKEAGARGYAGQFAADDSYDEKIAWLRQLLAWKDELASASPGAPGTPGWVPANGTHPLDAGGGSHSAWDQLKQTALDDHIYVLTPQARVIALPQGSTAIDFAYHLHTDLGHRCRGARVDGAMVPLNTPLRNGQTVDIIAVKQGGPSRDWLNPNLGYLQSPRGRQKVRTWFNALELQESVSNGRAMVEKTLQREGKTSVSLDDLAAKLGFKTPEALFLVVGKEEFSLRAIEQVLADPPPPADALPEIVARSSSGRSVASGASSGVLVAGEGALLTQLARCCRPAPPDPVAGFVTRGKGVSIHRRDCATFRRMASESPERVLETAWSDDALGQRGDTVYPVDLMIEAFDRQGLLRDISDIFAREKINVVGVQTVSKRNLAYMHFTIEVKNSAQAQRAVVVLSEIQGMIRASRR
ncbi:bifunctional (p)ppGpp synthetase/guanosine-3',5'-bis(diphosphate) 3'-pyrophosphohydrolase [Robbsia sp. Bb-Pol-6]|uniref:GTP pyrophosphokinase n=1 Tax=Robbsia betulipollinis TaxID=2981849 RepID=A0ABT3ZPQ7_9BURK|nr:bifunctional (p)ppGpp synthetase/guanosine-3',5'-bis(diphosphate) 3'-pyrophosphohydrolase [Robbsia betulipollinis]MCY0388467.1 bifunctional (p)ppGpp synthetase/guanosine-3',5'-bis(diphosphate) 3'-pyrophosphohydrolase [Robbsia betulipollinis]